MLPTYTLETARDEVADYWSQLGRISYEDLSPRAQESVEVLQLEGRYRHAHVRNCTWTYADLNEDTQEEVDAAVAEDYSALIEESCNE